MRFSVFVIKTYSGTGKRDFNLGLSFCFVRFFFTAAGAYQRPDREGSRNASRSLGITDRHLKGSAESSPSMNRIFKMTGSIVLDEVNILCKFQEDSRCQGGDLTELPRAIFECVQLN